MDKYRLYAPRGNFFVGPKMQVGGESGWWMRLAAGAVSCGSLDFDGTELIYLC